MAAKLSEKRRRFVEEYLVDANAHAAAERAGYSKHTAKAQGSRLLKFKDVKAALGAAQGRRAERLEIRADDVLREIVRFAMSDVGKLYDAKGNLLPIHEMPEDARRAVAGVKVFEEFEGSGENRVKVGEVREVKLWDKVRGLELLGKHLKLFTDTIEVKTDELDDEQRAERIAAILERARAKRARQAPQLPD